MKALIFSILSLIPLMCSENREATFAVADEATPAAEVTQSIRIPEVKEARPAQHELQVIRTANLRFESPDIEKSYADIFAVVRKYDGQLQNDAQGKDYESVFRNLTIRIPASNLDKFLDQIGKGVKYFDRKEISAQDVTEEFIDVQARLSTKKALESRYLSLLNKASKISEIVAIEKELAAVRAEIESMEGRLKFIRDRVAMSTVTIEIYKLTETGEGATISYGAKMWNAVKSGLNGISVFFLGLLYVWPFIVILVVVIFMIRRRILKRKKI